MSRDTEEDKQRRMGLPLEGKADPRSMWEAADRIASTTGTTAQELADHAEWLVDTPDEQVVRAQSTEMARKLRSGEPPNKLERNMLINFFSRVGQGEDPSKILFQETKRKHRLRDAVVTQAVLAVMAAYSEDRGDVEGQVAERYDLSKALVNKIVTRNQREILEGHVHPGLRAIFPEWCDKRLRDLGPQDGDSEVTRRSSELLSKKL